MENKGTFLKTVYFCAWIQIQFKHTTVGIELCRLPGQQPCGVYDYCVVALYPIIKNTARGLEPILVPSRHEVKVLITLFQGLSSANRCPVDAYSAGFKNKVYNLQLTTKWNILILWTRHILFKVILVKYNSNNKKKKKAPTTTLPHLLTN